MTNYAQRQKDHDDVLAAMGLTMFREYDSNELFKHHHKLLALHTGMQQHEFMGLNLIAPEGVYTPFAKNSSTYFMSQIVQMQDVGTPPSILEIGTGSGGVLLSLAQHFGPEGRYVGTDICPTAVKTASLNAKTNNLNVDIIQSDLFEALEDINFKAILFNIPLINRVPENDIEKYMLCDPDGQIMERFFNQLLEHHIKDQSVFLHVSNIGCLAPLKPFSKQITICKIQRFSNGMVRMIIEVKF